MEMRVTTKVYQFMNVLFTGIEGAEAHLDGKEEVKVKFASIDADDWANLKQQTYESMENLQVDLFDTFEDAQAETIDFNY